MNATEEDDPHRTLKEVVRISKLVMSFFITSFSVFVCFYGILSGESSFEAFTNPVAQAIVFIVVVTLLAYLEGLQICIIELADIPEATFKLRYANTHPRSCVNHDLINGKNGVQKFLIGRQIFVVLVVFISAGLTTFNDWETVFGSDAEWPGFIRRVFFDTGLFGVVIVVSFGQLAPQLFCAAMPVTAIGLYGSWSVIKIAMLLEKTGITEISWFLGNGFGWLVTGCGRKKEQSHLEISPHRKSIRGVHPILMGTLSGDSDDESVSIPAPPPDRPMAPPVAYAPESPKGSIELGSLRGIDVDEYGVEKGFNDDGKSIEDNDPFRLGMALTPKRHLYRIPADIRGQMEKRGLHVPEFLYEADDSKHIPPHIVACEQLFRNHEARQHLKKIVRLTRILTERAKRLEASMRTWGEGDADDEESKIMRQLHKSMMRALRDAGKLRVLAGFALHQLADTKPRVDEVISIYSGVDPPTATNSNMAI